MFTYTVTLIQPFFDNENAYPEYRWLLHVAHVVFDVSHLMVDGQEGVLALTAAQLHSEIDISSLICNGFVVNLRT